MYQRSQVHGRRLCSGLTGVCLLLLFAASHAKAGPLPPPPPPPLAPLLLNGTLLFNLIPRVDFVDFGNYSLFQPGPTPNEDSIMLFRRLRAKPEKIIVDVQAASPNSKNTPRIAIRIVL
jgi:hypothetical protein